MKIYGENKYGEVIYVKDIIAKLVGISIMECFGVVGMVNKNIKSKVIGLLKKDQLNKGVELSQVDNKINVTVNIVAQYGININTVCENIRERLTYVLEESCKIKINDITINVCDIKKSTWE